MTKPKPDKVRTFDELPLAVRTDVAQARNMRARVVAKRAEMLQESRLFKQMIVRLHRTHGLTTNRIATLMDVTWDWIDDILTKEGAKR